MPETPSVDAELLKKITEEMQATEPPVQTSSPEVPSAESNVSLENNVSQLQESIESFQPKTEETTPDNNALPNTSDEISQLLKAAGMHTGEETQPPIQQPEQLTKPIKPIRFPRLRKFGQWLRGVLLGKKRAPIGQH